MVTVGLMAPPLVAASMCFKRASKISSVPSTDWASLTLSDFQCNLDAENEGCGQIAYLMERIGLMYNYVFRH